jgi:hypothetical protein
MKSSPSILVVMALLVLIATSAPSKVEARTTPLSVQVTESCSGLPLPIVHLRFAPTAIVFELEYPAAGSRIASTRQLASLRFNFLQSGNAQIVLESHHVRLAFPRRSA